MHVCMYICVCVRIYACMVAQYQKTLFSPFYFTKNCFSQGTMLGWGRFVIRKLAPNPAWCKAGESTAN